MTSLVLPPLWRLATLPKSDINVMQVLRYAHSEDISPFPPFRQSDRFPHRSLPLLDGNGYNPPPSGTYNLRWGEQEELSECEAKVSCEWRIAWSIDSRTWDFHLEQTGPNQHMRLSKYNRQYYIMMSRLSTACQQSSIFNSYLGCARYFFVRQYSPALEICMNSLYLSTWGCDIKGEVRGRVDFVSKACGQVELSCSTNA